MDAEMAGYYCIPRILFIDILKIMGKSIHNNQQLMNVTKRMEMHLWRERLSNSHREASTSFRQAEISDRPDTHVPRDLYEAIEMYMSLTKSEINCLDGLSIEYPPTQSDAEDSRDVQDVSQESMLDLNNLHTCNDLGEPNESCSLENDQNVRDTENVMNGCYGENCTDVISSLQDVQCISDFTNVQYESDTKNSLCDVLNVVNVDDVLSEHDVELDHSESDVPNYSGNMLNESFETTPNRMEAIPREALKTPTSSKPPPSVETTEVKHLRPQRTKKLKRCYCCLSPSPSQL